MKLAEAVTRFLATRQSAVLSDHPDDIQTKALHLLTEYFSADATLSDLLPSSVRDFLSRWYVEKVSTPTLEESDMVDSIEQFIGWADRQTGAGQATGLLPVLDEMRRDLGIDVKRPTT